MAYAQQKKRFFLKSPQRGFTLIEIIVVIVVLSILAVLGGKFVVESTTAYQTIQARSRLMNTGRQAIERMSRQLRSSLPYSVRITNGGMCLEFFPIAAGGNYVNEVPDAVNGMATTASINVSPHMLDFGTAQYVSIGAMAVNELYGNSPASRANLSSRTTTSLTLSTPMRWARNSINQRFYLLDAPQAFCVVANQLRFYSGQDATGTGVSTASGFSLLAENVAATTPFSLSAGSENRNTIVQFAVSFTSGAESIALNHSVMIRNVP